MSESLFDIFGDHGHRGAFQNVSRQPLSNVENYGKVKSSGPIKPNEPVKRLVDPKKSFLANSGKSILSTPLRSALTPRAANVGAMIYSDSKTKGTKMTNEINYEEIEFTKPTKIFDNYQLDMFDALPKPEPVQQESPANTPPPKTRRPSLEFNCSYQDEFFTDDFSNDAFPSEEDLGLPDLY